METPRSGRFDELTLDHVTFCVSDPATTGEQLSRGYGLDRYLGSATDAVQALGRNRIRLVLRGPGTGDRRDLEYLRRHGDGISDIALGVPDAAAAYRAALRAGARPVRGPAEFGAGVTATIAGFGDVTHTFVQRRSDPRALTLPGSAGQPTRVPGEGPGLLSVDHFAVCVPAGGLDSTVQYYANVLGLDLVFEERIAVGNQAIETKAVQSRSGELTLTLIEPDPGGEPGQIDDFLADHGGPGVQHLALATDDAVGSVGRMAVAGVEFLRTPAAYYDLMGERLVPSAHSLAELREHGLLIDQDHGGQLFQIFAKSVHPRKTFFFEVIERMGALTFGGGNIAALYEAVQRQRAAEAPRHPDPVLRRG